MLSLFVKMMGGAVAAFVVGVVLHNVVSALLGVEEPVFFLIAVVVAPAAFIVAAVGTVVILVRRLFAAS